MKNILSISLLILSSQLIAGNTDVAYPQGYKEWKHIKTMIIKKNHPLAESFHGIHHVYANDEAFKGYKTGKFEEGSIITLDLLNYVDINETIGETSRIYVAVMHKNNEKYKNTHGWGYEAFKGDTHEKLVDNVQNMCVKCHESQKDNDFIFSKIRK
jgi:hypothetical protein